MKAQEKHLSDNDPGVSQQNTNQALKPKQNPITKRKENVTTKNPSQSGDEQHIPKHTRKPLEIPPVGSKIRTIHKGQTYEAVIVDDPGNTRSNGRSVLFNGTVFKTLTSAAHDISPGINSGSVWEQV